ncbi:MAG: LytTR family DNA-binding domain-containing protein [Bacteroidales bacterium]|jgi:two-component system, LytTR family, response regulator|nr:LytTR family DNA-binding domain-containing protein [Bacteroidales bacterium]MDD2205250.1 LytTR family DNA-binding domain-containing protein [Bacteroidales bacterium]MDD3151455.1 LytTR family DNA-binding domain-containing protein [Bacteroidales bacterium]MDD3914410.1 LytTR family DNA-binding domain-containing protein [Bacteroidales bacterium]MDD4634591.1 LytTR family DNA-binding domain-containing protein [Bacteroidales bacterium]
MILNCIAIDDEPLALKLIEKYIEKTPFLKLQKSYNNAVTVMNNLPFYDIQLLFLDIQMPELSGLDFAKQLKLNTECKIIFTTAFQDYAIDSYSVNAMDYLLKPISYPDFLKAANKALQWFELLEKTKENNDISTIYIKSNHKIVPILLSKLLYVEGLKDYVKFYTEDLPSPIVSLMTMKYLEEILPADICLRIHRSFIINKTKINCIEKAKIAIGDKQFPIGDSYKESVFKTLNIS